jgi:hypothetical protein
MTNGVDHNQGGGKHSEKPAGQPKPCEKPAPAVKPEADRGGVKEAK